MCSWEKVIQLDPSNTDAYSGLATALFITEDYQRCEEVLATGYKRFPENVNIVFNLGNLYVRQGKHELALPYLERTVELAPDYRNAKSMLEKTLTKLA